MEAGGYTQGTTYSVVYYDLHARNYQYQLDSLLLAFDRVLSTYQESSYISRWNRSESGLNGEEQPPWFRAVVKRAAEIHQSTNGALDISVAPLMEQWFSGNADNSLPDSLVIDSIMMSVGMHHIQDADGSYLKNDARVRLDVNAIAQGYAVDVLARFLEAQGVYNYLVEIGGEVRARGSKPDDVIWSIGIDVPKQNEGQRELATSLKLKDRALATSGNYRKYVELDGERYGHSIDPRSGYPARNSLLSATIVAKDCMTADALATACMVLGTEKAKALIEADPELDGLLIYSIGQDMETWMSEGIVVAESDS